MVAKLVAGLDDMRLGDGRWSNTQDNLWGLIALSDYARTVATGSGWVEILAGGKRLTRKKLEGAEVVVFRTGLDGLSTDAITVKADKGVHWSARLVQTRVDDGAAIAKGFTVTREYLDAKGNAITKVAAGEMITVRLTVVVDAETEWVALVDPLPAGLEAVNPNLVAGDDADLSQSGPGHDYYWEPPTWGHTELRDDEVRWFADRIGGGTHVMTYKARATIDGTFEVPPAHIEAMYAPEVRGRTATVRFEVTK
jgi:uncharacterized protein YfaS (alpha-2-macroglobulin family)